MSMIHFIGGEKGGVGKSVLSRLLSQYFLDNNIQFAGIDADQSHQTLTRYYRDYTQSINLDLFESIDQVMEIAIEKSCDVLTDLPAQSQRFLDRWIDENGALELCDELDIRVVYWYLVDGGPDSVELLNNFLAKYGNKLSIVVVKNHGCGSDFSNIESIARLKALTAQAGSNTVEIDLPALHQPTMHKINKLGLSYWAAVNLKEASTEHLGLMERQRSRVWLNKAYKAIETVFMGAAKL